MPDDMRQDRDLVLPPNAYSFILDETKGQVNVYVGPTKLSLAGTDKLVTWNGKRFLPAQSQEQAIAAFTVAGEGQYIVLENPAMENGHPPRGTSTPAAELQVGRKVNVPGPATFALWPGQRAEPLEGHHLRHNQYLLVRVYDAEQAQTNWDRAVVATQGDGDEPAVIPTPQTFSMGQLIIIKGTEVSFYIPPTGIEVVRDDAGNYVRDAVTLERLEYCILLDENGEKRYVQGPDVVFPKPTEKFLTSETEYATQPGVTPRSDKTRKFKAVELNEHSGLYIKVIADYEEDNGTERHAGDELFITGGDGGTPIYFPRSEHSIIRYGDKKVHYAIAIPAGEGRYVLDRDTGSVILVTGPAMFLPDPRRQVLVRRILSPKLGELLYPGNREVQEVNDTYRQQAMVQQGFAESYDEAQYRMSSVRNLRTSNLSDPNLIAGAVQDVAMGDEFSRGTTYSRPRSITLDTKYDGAVTVQIWPGYAILVTDKAGGRRVEVGPKVVLLEYDEIVQPVELSTGRPKSDSHLLRTAYLRVGNNHVSDLVTVQTKDLVDVTVELSYRVNFEAETEAEMLMWFDVENYVKVMTDHARSRLRNAAKRVGVQEFYTNTIDIIRDTILGTKSSEADTARNGMFFPENGMRVYDVDILNVTIGDPDVAHMLERAQEEALRGALDVSAAEGKAAMTALLEGYKRQEMTDREATAKASAQIIMAEIGRKLDANLAEVAARLETATQEGEVARVRLVLDRETEAQAIEMQRAHDEANMDRLHREVEEYVARMTAVSPELVGAIQALGDQNLTETIVKAIGPVAMTTGVTTSDLMGRIFDGTPLGEVFTGLSRRPLARAAGNNAEPF